MSNFVLTVFCYASSSQLYFSWPPLGSSCSTTYTYYSSPLNFPAAVSFPHSIVLSKWKYFYKSQLLIVPLLSLLQFVQLLYLKLQWFVETFVQIKSIGMIWLQLFSSFLLGQTLFFVVWVSTCYAVEFRMESLWTPLVAAKPH